MHGSAPGGGTSIPFVWLAQAGAEYDSNKIVYLTPQYYGFDFGVDYAPKMGNSFQNGGLGVGCNQAGPTCINVSSGNDPTRWLNKVAVGLRFQQAFGAVDLKAYGYYSTAGKEDIHDAAYSTPAAQRALPGGGSAQLLHYDNLSFYKAGVADHRNGYHSCRRLHRWPDQRSARHGTDRRRADTTPWSQV